MFEEREAILNSQEVVEGVKEAYAVGGIEECQRRGFNVHEVRSPHPNEIVKEVVIYERYEHDDGLGTITRKREVKVGNPQKYGMAKRLLNTLTETCLPIWREQMKHLKIGESATWLEAFEEREAKKNE